MNRESNGPGDTTSTPTYLFSLSSSSTIVASLGTVIMFTVADSTIIGMCLEGFLYGKISVLRTFKLLYILAKEVKL